MARSYTQELAAWVDGRAKRRRQQDAAAVAFLAVRAQVSAAIDAGYALTTVWAHMHETGKLRCGYETFRKHVRRFITAAPAHRAAVDARPPDDRAKARVAAVERAARARSDRCAPPAMGGFTFDAMPRKEDLI